MRRKSHYRPQFDSLEVKALMASVPLLSSVPGAGVITPVTGVDVQAMQQGTSSNNLELVLSQTQLLLGARTDVSQYAAMLLQEHRDVGFRLRLLAESRGVILPNSLLPPEQAIATQVLQATASGGANFDQTYLNAMVQSHTATIANVQQQISTVSDQAFRTFLQGILPSLQNHLARAQQLLAGPATINPPTPPAGTSTLSTSDTQVLTQAYSSDWLNRYMAHVANLIGTQRQGQAGQASFQSYTIKTINDYADSMYKFELVASGTGTPLPAGLQANEAQVATQLFTGLVNANLRQAQIVYLTTLQQANQQGTQRINGALGSVQNASLQQVLQANVATATLNMQGADAFLTSNSFPMPQGIHARQVARAYRQLFGRNPTWSESYYWVNQIRARPRSRAWYNQLSGSNSGQIPFATGQFGYYNGNGGNGGTGSGSGGPVVGSARGRDGSVRGQYRGTGSGAGGPVLVGRFARLRVARPNRAGLAPVW